MLKEIQNKYGNFSPVFGLTSAWNGDYYTSIFIFKRESTVYFDENYCGMLTMDVVGTEFRGIAEFMLRVEGFLWKKWRVSGKGSTRAERRSSHLDDICLSTHFSKVRTESVEGKRLSAFVFVTWEPTTLNVNDIPFKALMASSSVTSSPTNIILSLSDQSTP